MILRPMIIEDLEQVVEIEKVSMPSPWSKELFEEEVKSEVAGYMGYWEAPEEAHIINLAISPKFRHKGFGFQIMEYCLRFAYNKGARLATLEVRESNEAAQRLYEKMDFRTVAIRKKYYSDNQENAVVMLKELE